MELKRNMFGEMNWICFWLGHKWCDYSCYEITGSNSLVLCQRCELYNGKGTWEDWKKRIVEVQER